MKVLYIANHNCGDNDDEGAISFALEQLGCEVVKVHQTRKYRNKPTDLNSIKADFCLFHKWPTISEISSLSIPSCFWYFDLVSTRFADSTLTSRCETRQSWFKDVLDLPLCKLGFCTDGDWVSEDKTGKLRWLMQGADERTLGKGTRTYDVSPILFTGMKHHGAKRAAHIDYLTNKWGSKFTVLGDGGPKYRKHGRELANLFASTSIVVAPDGPCTDHYWSNRVYLTLGLGGFLLHPSCSELKQFYKPEELETYESWDHLDSLINYYLDNPSKVEEMREAGIRATIERNLYVHRCQILLKEMRSVC